MGPLWKRQRKRVSSMVTDVDRKHTTHRLAELAETSRRVPITFNVDRINVAAKEVYGRWCPIVLVVNYDLGGMAPRSASSIVVSSGFIAFIDSLERPRRFLSGSSRISASNFAHRRAADGRLEQRC